jgi:hypothetical protein
MNKRLLPRDELPDLWPEIERRLAEPHYQVPRRLGRATAVVVALLLFAASSVLVWRAFTADERGKKPVAGPLDGIAEGWTRLPAPPEVRPGAAYLWTGSQLLVWGGCAPPVTDECIPTQDGFAFDPVTERWSAIPAAPTAGDYAETVWTGREAIFLSLASRGRVGGQAYDPATRMWRTIAEAPIELRDGSVAVWTGSRIFVWGGGERLDPATDGALYDPLADAWSLISPSPIALNQASGVWTGSEVIVFGSLLDNGNHAETDTSVGAAYDPATDAWRRLPRSHLSPQAVSAVWASDRMVAYDYGWKAQTYTPSTNDWQPVPDLLFHSGECYPDGAVVGVNVFAFGCGEAATWNPGQDTWHEVRGGITDATIEANGATYKLWRFATLVPAGEVLFLSAKGLTVDPSGTPCYGCAGSPTSLWVYRPAS